MKAGSEQRNLIELKKKGPMGDFDVYKACISQANLGATLQEENVLGETEKALLEARRLLSRAKLSEVKNLLETLQPNHPLLKGDREFLMGQYFHRSGNQQKASEFMMASALCYSLAGESYRELRACTNAAICVSTLESCLYGDLMSYEQEARREGYLDLAANIVRTRAMKLLIAGQLIEAHLQAMDAADLYQLEGYPDDRSIALLVGAIALQMNGEPQRAQQIRSMCFVIVEKVKPYIMVYESLVQGKTPKLYPGHPLSEVKWKKSALKSDSIPGKIIQILKEKPSSRDELIANVWGESATDISYCSRLYTAINYIKKSKGITIAFDGEKYKITG